MPGRREGQLMNYGQIVQEMRALVKDVPHRTANFANASALLADRLPELNWAGFYFLCGEKLVLGPFQGKPACIEIPLGRGVCGTAALADETLLVPDVHEFPGHIACDSASRSEIVIPLHEGGRVIGVLDIDSPEPARFTEEDRVGLQEIARVLEEEVLK